MVSLGAEVSADQAVRRLLEEERELGALDAANDVDEAITLVRQGTRTLEVFPRGVAIGDAPVLERHDPAHDNALEVEVGEPEALVHVE